MAAGLHEGLSTRIEAGGERRRLLLARALLDERGDHLDTDGAYALGAELRHHAGSHGAAVVVAVVVTHDDTAVVAADRVLALDESRGWLVVPASPP